MNSNAGPHARKLHIPNWR